MTNNKQMVLDDLRFLKTFFICGQCGLMVEYLLTREGFMSLMTKTIKDGIIEGIELKVDCPYCKNFDIISVNVKGN